MKLSTPDLALLRCPRCRASLTATGPALRCDSCAALWPLADGLPLLYRADAVRGPDRVMQQVYDAFAGLHDVGVRYLLPLLELDLQDLRAGRAMTEGRLRSGYLQRLGLSPPPRPRPGRPLRILEVGIGTGANLPYLREALPDFAAVEYWGLDLSRGMLAQCQRRVRRLGLRNVRLALADAHALPLPDGAFDRVFHVGGIAAFRDPGAALAEMARVAAPGTPIVIVDEGLEPRRPIGAYHRAGFRLITLGAPTARCPSDLLPPQAVDVEETWVSRFYYCLRFVMPAPPPAAAARAAPL